MNILKSTLAAALGILLPGTALASQLDYSPSVEGIAPGYVGTANGETYHVAVSLTDPNMAGMKVKSIKVDFPADCQPTDVSAWLTSKLSVQIIKGKRQNVVDITSVDATVTDGVLSVDFGDDFTIPAEGLYAGYSFTVADGEGANAAPVAVTPGHMDGGLWMYTTRKYMSWEQRVSTFNAVSAMQVILDGDVQAQSAGVTLPADTRYKYTDASFQLPVVLTSHGTEPISSVDYTFSAGSRKGSGSYTLPEPVPVQWGHDLEVFLPVEGISAKGSETLTLTIDKVNGHANPDKSAESAGTVSGLIQVPVNRPLVEEYTGLWCGYCPRGAAGMEHMKNEWGDGFVSVSFHDKDVMTIYGREQFPCTTATFPCAWINRAQVTDPYLGEESPTQGLAGPFGFDKQWLKHQTVFTPVAISGCAYFDENDDDLVHVMANVQFVEPVSKKYRIGYFLVEDALEGANWYQYNYYSGWEAYYGIEEMYTYVYGESMINTLYNDVVIQTSDVKGEAGSLPAQIVPEREYFHSYDFIPSEAKNLNGTLIYQDPDYLRAIIFVIEEGGNTHILNCISVDVLPKAPAQSGVEEAAAEVMPVAEAYYTLGGVRVQNPASGVYVKVVTLSDGSRTTSKVIL